MGKYRKVSLETKERIKKEYIENFTTTRKLAKKYQIPHRTVEGWCAKEKWSQLRNLPDPNVVDLSTISKEIKDPKHGDIGQLLQRRGVETLLKFQGKPLNTMQALKLIMQGIEIERLAYDLDNPVPPTPPKPNTDHLAQYFEGEIIEEDQPVSSPPSAVISDRDIEAFTKK